MDENILIIKAPISSKKEDVFKGIKNDENLIDSINDFKRKLNHNNIEIFEQRENIIVAEDGYYLAVYPSDVKKI